MIVTRLIRQLLAAVYATSALLTVGSAIFWGGLDGVSSDRLIMGGVVLALLAVAQEIACISDGNRGG